MVSSVKLWLTNGGGEKGRNWSRSGKLCKEADEHVDDVLLRFEDELILAGGVDSAVSDAGVECCWYRFWLGGVIGETGELGELQTPSSWVFSNAKSC